MGKSLYISQLIQKENFKSKPKNVVLKKAYFWVTLIQAVVSKTLREDSHEKSVFIGQTTKVLPSLP